MSERSNSPWIKPEAEVTVGLEDGDLYTDVFKRTWDLVEGQIDDQLHKYEKRIIAEI